MMVQISTVTDISVLILQDLYSGDDWDLHCLGPHTQGDTGWTGVYIYTGDNQLPRPSIRCCFLIGRFGTYGQREGTLRRITCRVVHVYTVHRVTLTYLDPLVGIVVLAVYKIWYLYNRVPSGR